MGDVFNFIGNTITGLFDCIANVVDELLRAIYRIGDALSHIGEWISHNMITFILIVVAVVVIVYFWWLAPNLYATYATAIEGGYSTWGAVCATAATYQSVLQTVLSNLYLGLMMKIHIVAYTISAEYRETVAKIFTQISMVSASLGLGASFMHVILQDARTLILDVSTTLGRPYDLAEITWMNELSGYMQKFAGVAKSYQNNPVGLINDLNQWLVRPALDTKGTFMSTMITSVAMGADLIKATVDKVSLIKQDIDKLIIDLPASWTRDILAAWTPFRKDYDKFIHETYEPVMAGVNVALNQLTDQEKVLRTKTASLFAIINHPALIAKQASSLPDDERKATERVFGSMAVESGLDETDVMNEEVLPDVEAMTEEMTRPFEPMEPNLWEIRKVGGPLAKGIPAIPQKEKWEVGDY